MDKSLVIQEENTEKIPSKSIIPNNPTKDALIGLTAINQDLILLNYGNVTIRRDYQTMETVRIISGGHSGKELCYAGLVGKGLLTAAIQGDIPPCMRDILQTIREICLKDNPEVLVLIQPNNINFNLAVEKSINDGLRVKLLIISDIYDTSSNNEERDSCGIVLISKLAGGMAQRGSNLREIYNFCNNSINYLFSKIIYISDADSINQFFDDFQTKINPTFPVVLLMNSNKLVTWQESSTLFKQIIDKFKIAEIKCVRAYSGTFLSSTKNSIVSLSIMSVYDEKILLYLDEPCSTSAWITLNQSISNLITDNEMKGRLNKKSRLSPPIRGPILDNKAEKVVILCLQFACDALVSCEKQIILIDSERSCGNMGKRVTKACNAITKKLKNKKLITNRPFTLFQSLGKITEREIGGTMGTVCGLLCEGAASVFSELPDNEQITGNIWLKVFKSAIKTLENCNAELGKNTVYDPLKACEEVVDEKLSLECGYMESFSFGVNYAQETADQTKGEQYKYPDTGAHVTGVWLRAVFEAVKLFYGCDY